jgi:hypothetical protein
MLAITIGYKENGRSAEPIVLYVGGNADAATQALNNPPPGIIRTGLIKHPIVNPNRYFPENAVPAIALQTELPVDPASKKKKSSTDH